MSDADPGSPGYNQPAPPFTPPTPTPTTPIPPSSPEGSDQTSRDDDGKMNVAEEARKVGGSPTDLHRLHPDTVKKADDFEEKRKHDLDEERAEHMRQRGNPTR